MPASGSQVALRPDAEVRRAANAGTFYPAEPAKLAATVEALLGDLPTGSAWPKAIVAPHAGYIYSGKTAGAAFRLLAPARGTVTRVILLGPSHRHAFSGMAATFAPAYETLLGRVPVDQAWLDHARDVPMLGFSDEAHEGDHALETHLPFLQMVLGKFSLVPIICGRAGPQQVAAFLDRVWGGPETLIVISSDLSHFLDYDACEAIDAKTCAAIERLDSKFLTSQHACGAVPLNGLLASAAARHMRVETLARCNSGDTAGSRERVVGYGAWALYEQDAALAPYADFVRREGKRINAIARAAIKGEAEVEEPSSFGEKGACFVTLHKNGRLRGCYGSVSAWRPLLEDLRVNARKSAFEDPRFAPLEHSEWDAITLSVTLLTPLRPMRFRDEADLLAQLQPLQDGLVIEDGGRRALFLPSVWESLPDKRVFLAHLKVKAGLSADHWSDSFRAHLFNGLQTLEEPL